MVQVSCAQNFMKQLNYHTGKLHLIEDLEIYDLVEPLFKCIGNGER